MEIGWRKAVWAGVLGGAALLAAPGGAAWAQQGGAIPDAPAPQPSAADAGSLTDLKDKVTPGVGTTPPPAPAPGANQVPAEPAAGQSNSSSSSNEPQGTAANDDSAPQAEAPEIPAKGQGPIATIRIPVNEVIVPVTVRDKKNALVPGLDYRVFRVYEDGVRQKIVFFTVDPYPLLVAFVVDQSLPADVMARVNESLSALTGAFTPQDSVAVFGYNTSVREVTQFTGAEGPRLQVALQAAKAPGRDMGVVAPGGPLDDGPMINSKMVDPNLAPNHGMNGNMGIGFSQLPKDTHPLNDAILAAAEELAKQRDTPQTGRRRRIIYVISDGKEQGSKASYKEVVRYLLTNSISLYGTLVGDSAIWGIGYLDKKHIPLLPTMRDNILPKYAIATGGLLDAELSENGIQQSFAKITDSVRTQYTLGYVSHASALASRFHTIEVRVEGVPNLSITTRDGFYPSTDMNH